MPAGTRRDTAGGDGTLERRLAALEEVVQAMAAEVRTRRLVVAAGRDAARVVAEVVRGTAELRLELPDGGGGARTAAVLFASPDGPPPGAEGRTGGAGGGAPHGRGPDGARPRAGGTGLGAGIGLQLWADGDAVAELDAWPDENGRWRPQLHLDG